MKMTMEDNKRLFEELKNYEKGTKEYNKLYWEIVSKNEPFVGYITKKFENGHKHEIDDIFSAGKFGLMKAVGTFDSDKGLAFGAYASRCVENEILMYLRCENKKIRRAGVSLNSVIAYDKHGDGLIIEETLASDEDIEADVVDVDEKDWEMKEVLRLIDKLPSKQAMALKLRYLSCGDEKINQIEVAKIINVSQAHVARLEKDAIKNLKALISGEKTEIVKQKKVKCNKEYDIKTTQQLIENIDKEPMQAKEGLRNIIYAKLARVQSRVLKTLYFSPEKTDLKATSEILNSNYKAVQRSEYRGVKKLQEILNEELGKNLSTKDIRKILRYHEENEG